MFQKVKTFFVPVMAFVTETIIPKIKSRKLFYAGAGVISSPILLNPLFWLAVTPVVIAIGVYLNFKVLHGKKNPCEMEREFKKTRTRNRYARKAVHDDEDYCDSED